MPTRSTPHGPPTSSVAPMPDDSVAMNPVRPRAVGRLEPCAGKLACTVLRGGHAGNGVPLPDVQNQEALQVRRQGQLGTHAQERPDRRGQVFPRQSVRRHALSAQLEQTSTLLQEICVLPKVAVVDLGYRGMDKKIAPVELIHT